MLADRRRAGWAQRTRAWVAGAGLDLGYPLLVLVTIGVLSGLGVSGSSLALLSPTGRPDGQALVAGTARPIRTDEWLADSPLRIGRVRAGFPATRTYGLGRPDLADSWQPLLPARNLGAALYAPENLPLLVLPLDQGFALSWWLPFAACALGLYAWLRGLRVSRGVALIASLVTVFAPAAAWWSTSMVLAVASAAVPCALLVAATRLWARRRALAAAAAVLAGLAAAGLPWWYQPWSLVAGLFIGGVTVLWGLSDRDRRRPFVLAALLAGVLFVGEEIAYVLHERAYYDALTNTVYPGQRRSTGGGVPLWKLFTSQVPFSFLGRTGATLRKQNLTELAMGWTLALPLGVAIGAAGWRAVRADAERLLLVGTAAVGLGLASWCVVPWPSALATVTFLDYVPPYRMAPFVGLFGTVLLALLFATPARRAALLDQLRTVHAVVIGAGAALLSWWTTSTFRHEALPGLSTTELWLAVVATGVVAALLCTRRWAWAATVAAAIAVTSGVMVNPLVQGTGALAESTPARLVRHLDRVDVAPQHGTWASDSVLVDALLNGEGVDSVTSFNNPVDAQGWQRLDPHDRSEQHWNRFGYISFAWDPAASGVSITNPRLDAVRVTIDPCSPALDPFRLRMIVSSRPLRAPCLTPAGRFLWMGSHDTVYRRAP